MGPRRPTQSHHQLGVDRAAIQIVDYHLPDVSHRGDITEDDTTKVATEIKSIDPDGQCMVIFIAAPPCQDFLRIGDRAGHQGERGYLFNFTAKFIAELRGLTAPRHPSRRSGGLQSLGVPTGPDRRGRLRLDRQSSAVVVHHRLGGG